MNPTPSIALTLTFLAGLIACGDESRDKAHQAVDAVHDRVEETRDDVRRALVAGAEDLERMQRELSAGAGELSEAAKEKYSDQLAELEKQRRELDERLEPAWNAGAQALSEWEAEADELRARCAAAWEAFQAAEQDADGK
jgi:vacuolar-type H+-ATPase subunit I/STV1